MEMFSYKYLRLQENHEYLIRIFARNENGLSEPLETEEPYTVQRPFGIYVLISEIFILVLIY